MTGEPDMPEGLRIDISLYEFYALAINDLLAKAPWELVRAVSEYHGNFLTEQRCLGLSVLLLMGENLVPLKAVETLPIKYAAQAKASVNQATFLRALKHYFEQHGIEPRRADMVLERMHSYLTDSRAADQSGNDPLDAMGGVLTKRVPPKNERQHELYVQRVEHIFDYIQALVDDNLLARYQVTS
jgi:hypothetical protein